MRDMKWVYVQSEPGLWTVGFYDPSGKWHTDSDHSDRENAAERCAWLNGDPDALSDEADARAEIRHGQY